MDSRHARELCQGAGTRGLDLVEFDAGRMLREATAKHHIHLSVLVAETALWASPEVHRRLVEENGTGAYFPRMRRHRRPAGERPGTVVDGVRLDSNTYANHAIKRALGLPRGTEKGFEACHIWPRSCYDPDCHTTIANLILLPRALGALSDHDEEISAALRFRSYELYGWHPVTEQAPVRPEFYPQNWREPMPFSDRVARSIAGRRAMLPPEEPLGEA